MSATVMQLSIKAFSTRFNTEEKCRDYLVENRWKSGAFCPRCACTNVHQMKDQKYSRICYNCDQRGYHFSILVGTIFENTKIPLKEWFKVVYLMLMSKKGMSALQVHRMMGFGSYRTAWSMCHRVRAGLGESAFTRVMGDVVEVDETWIGGIESNKHKSKKKKLGRGTVGKIPVIGALSRSTGTVVARVIEKCDTATLEGFVREMVSTRVSLLATDEAAGYKKLGEDYLHQSVNHGHGQYVSGQIHTNSIEGFWSLFKRGVMGSFHKVSAKYLPLYVKEFEWRYNNRKNEAIFEACIAGF